MKYYLLKTPDSKISLLIKDDPESSFIKYFDHLVIKCKKAPDPDKIKLKRIIAFKNFKNSNFVFEKLTTYEKGRLFKRKTIFWVLGAETKKEIKLKFRDIIVHTTDVLYNQENLKVVKTLEFDSDEDAKLWFEMECNF